MKTCRKSALIWGFLPWFCFWLWSPGPAHAESNQASLGPLRKEEKGWRVQGGGPTNQAFTLFASSNLVEWSSIALLDPRLRNPITDEVIAGQPEFSFLDLSMAYSGRKFYRLWTAPFASTNDWKSQAFYPQDAFASRAGSEGSGGSRWLKFAILRSDPTRVYYQNSELDVLHYDFAARRLPAFKGMSRAAFDQVSLYLSNQQVLLGTLLFAPGDYPGEYAIQFAGRDPYPRETVRQFFELIRSTVIAEPSVVPFYFPAYEQSQAAALDESYFAAHGIRVSSANRWVRGDQVYAAGWALGRIRFVAAADINSAYTDGRLRPQDILITDGVPAEVPFVAGIISIAPATPNSHVAILAGAYGVPFVYLADSAARKRALQLDGQEALLQAAIKDGFGSVQLLSVDGTLDPALRTELLALKIPPATLVSPKAKFGAISAPAEQLSPDDIRFFGGKAANFGLLRRVVPTNSPPAVAFSFDLWDAFMAQAMPSGKSLQSEINGRLARHTYPPDLAALAADLDAVRNWITKDARFSSEQRVQILTALGSFDADKNIRFRSSSNAEDTQTYAAAGLYDSYSGCLADDLDSDDQGPCRCDPAEIQERGVFRAMQKVYASFYNDNAFLERLRRGMNEAQLGMGLLVHLSTPDELELANGVATVRQVTPQFGDAQLQSILVTQAGAVSVSNPNGNARPETMEATEFGVSMKEPSSLVPAGSHVLTWPGEYESLSEMLFRVYRAYRSPSGTAVPSQAPVLDFEYKKVEPGKLILKQLRALPAPHATTQRYVLNEPTTYWVYQSESSDVLSNHRLKCFLFLENRNIQVDLTNLLTSFYSDAKLEWRSGTNVVTLTGPISSWPEAAHSLTNDPLRGLVTKDSWTSGQGESQRRFELTCVIPTATDGPFISQADIRKWLAVTYATPVPVLARANPSLTSREEIQLLAAPDLSSLVPGTSDSFTGTNGWRFEFAFLNSTNASGPPLGIDKNFWGTYPAALSPWLHTRITGITSAPLVLSSYWSQSAAAGHKFRYAWYVFEPRVEPNLSAEQRAELSAANVELIHIERETWLGGQVTIHVLGSDGKFRTP